MVRWLEMAEQRAKHDGRQADTAPSEYRRESEVSKIVEGSPAQCRVPVRSGVGSGTDQSAWPRLRANAVELPGDLNARLSPLPGG